MAPSNPVAAAVVQPHDFAFPAGSGYVHTMARQTVEVPEINTTQEEHQYYDKVPEGCPCWLYHKLKEEDAKKQVCIRVPSPPSSPRFPYEPYADEDKYRWNKCHLLSLPKDIRLKIWEYVLTDPSMPDLLIGIDRKPFSPSYKLSRPPTPELTFFHAERRNPISINILLASREIYEEALPILYESASFMPMDLGGLLPLFLNTLSPFARSCIRRIYLCIPKKSPTETFRRDCSKPIFHWAVTCAQIAQLNNTLEQVDIDGEWSVFEKMENRRAILFPLCKIKAQKRFLPCAKGEHDPQDYNAAFGELMVEAEQALKANAKLRVERTKADAIQRAREDETRKELERKEHNKWAEERCRLSSRSRFKVPLEDAVDCTMTLREQTHESREEWCRWAEENLTRMEQDPSRVSGIKQFEKELEQHAMEHDLIAEDWDLVSVSSGVSTPKARPASALSNCSDEIWPDTASTLVGRDDVNKKKVNEGEESDSESEGWEHIEW